jgi:hypothetical protein
MAFQYESVILLLNTNRGEPRMRMRMLVAALLALALPATQAAGQATPPKPAKVDPISGEWAASFEFAGGNPFTRTLKLELEGTRVSGTARDARLGDGTISGTWQAGELNVAIEGERGTMALAGALKDGKLSGDWDVGHAKGKWSATKKQAGERRAVVR